MKLREIERLRAVAVLLVLGLHWDCLHAFLPDVAGATWSGVDLFFVISGYVVTLSLLRLLPPLAAHASFAAAFDAARPALKAFYARRFFRILPAALAVLLVSRALVPLLPQNFGPASMWWRELFAFVGGLYNYVFPFHPEYHFGAYWSLAVEEHFYLVLPLLFVIARTPSRRLAACAVVGGACIVFRAFSHPEVEVPALGYYEKFSSHLRFDSLMAGVALALVARPKADPPILPPALVRWAIVPGCIAVVACLPGAAPDYVLQRQGFVALWMLSAILVGYASLDRGYVLAVPGLGRVLEHVGSRSYAIYLTHDVIDRLDTGLRGGWPAYAAWVPAGEPHPWRQLLVMGAGVLVAAEILHRAIEVPFLRLGRSLAEGKRVVAAGTIGTDAHASDSCPANETSQTAAERA